MIGSAVVIRELRERYYRAPGYAFLEQVAPHTGHPVGRRQRWLDAVAMQLYPSRGLELHGIEVKVSRGDFRRELEDPSKADAVARFCHRFFIAAPAGVVPIDELPLGWGLIEVSDIGAVKVRRRAEMRTPEAPGWDFVAAVLRRAAEQQIEMVNRAVFYHQELTGDPQPSHGSAEGQR